MRVGPPEPGQGTIHRRATSSSSAWLLLLGAARKAVKEEATNGSPAEAAQAQLRRDLKSGAENPS